VQRRDQPGSAASHHLLRQNGARRVRNGIVDVEKVELLVDADFHHLGSKRQGVMTVIEQRVLEHFDFVQKNVLPEPVKARRELGADEVHSVAPSGERQPDFSGNDSAAAEGRIAGDPDPQQPVLHSSTSRTSPAKGSREANTLSLSAATPYLQAK